MTRLLPASRPIVNGGESSSTSKAWLLKRNVNSLNYTQHIVGGYDAAVAAGTTIAGTPETVRAELERQIKALGVNHMNLAMFFGNMKLEDALRSQKLFASEVMPKLAAL